jgi:hypothetical protein
LGWPSSMACAGTRGQRLLQLAARPDLPLTPRRAPQLVLLGAPQHLALFRGTEAGAASTCECKYLPLCFALAKRPKYLRATPSTWGA